MDDKKYRIERLNRSYASCINCHKCIHKHKVFGIGDINSRICIIGNIPEQIDIDSKKPFASKTGILLEKIINSVGVNSSDIYYTNALLCMTNDKNRIPTDDEMSNCRKRLYKEISIIEPLVTILVGTTALRTVLGLHKKIATEHGNWKTTLSKPCYFYFPIYHPNWIMKSVSDGERKLRKEIMWADIQEFKEGLNTFKEHFREV